jgi:hypothetical protein
MAPSMVAIKTAEIRGKSYKPSIEMISTCA